MVRRFKNSWNRLDRAGLHRNSFKAEWDSLFGDGERSSSVRRDNKSPGWWILSADLSTDTIERIRNNQLSFILGEFAYQLRASLDGLIWDAVAYKQGKEPSPDEKGLANLEFPLAPTWKAKDTKHDRFHGFPFPQNLVDWMKTIQPGTADKPIGHPDLGLQITLQAIHNLARFDRHRRLRVISMLPLDDAYVRILGTEPPGGWVESCEWLECNPFDGKYDVVRFKVVGIGGLLPYKVSLEPYLRFSVFAEDIESYEGTGIGVELDRFIAATEHVISRFEEECV